MLDMTNTPEITMHEEAPKLSIADRIRKHKADNPNASAREISEAIGTHVVYVHQVLATPPKKPKKVEVAKKETKAPVASEKQISKKEHQRLLGELEVKNALIGAQLERIKNLLAITEYLEEKIEELNELKYR